MSYSDNKYVVPLNKVKHLDEYESKKIEEIKESRDDYDDIYVRYDHSSGIGTCIEVILIRYNNPKYPERGFTVLDIIDVTDYDSW